MDIIVKKENTGYIQHKFNCKEAHQGALITVDLREVASSRREEEKPQAFSV